MASVTKPALSPQEYLARERAQLEQKNEYYAGELVPMTGATEARNLIVGNLIRELGNQLDGQPCKVYASDMRVKIPDEDSYFYPDVSVVCGEAQFEDERRDTLLNPQVIIEVLSETTESYDRGRKFLNYRTIPSFREYLLVSQDEPVVEHFIRQENDQWLLKTIAAWTDEVDLPTLGCRLPIARIYRHVLQGP
jgi:Uma2 family endonuclease